MGEKNSPAYLKETEKPILIIQGSKDVQVREEVDFRLYKEMLEGRENVTFKLYPGLNHLFMPSAYGTLKDIKKEYKIKSKVDDTVIDDITDWIMSSCKSAEA
jgi:dipeptidyl aminopeptidase/acylaminoacyl peptidase